MPLSVCPYIIRKNRALHNHSKLGHMSVILKDAEKLKNARLKNGDD
ncbi:hypothetical protein HGQ85_15465 [Clostridioides difficile]|nr:hypothetical protein [Clostridioides difficile]